VARRSAEAAHAPMPLRAVRRRRSGVMIACHMCVAAADAPPHDACHAYDRLLFTRVRYEIGNRRQRRGVRASPVDLFVKSARHVLMRYATTAAP